MKKIRLTQGKVALVDDDDYERLSKYKWHAFHIKSNGAWYAARSGKSKAAPKIRMHREVMGLLPGCGGEVDHVDRDGLNNTKCNLRIATRSENCRNRRAPHGKTSKYRGVSRHANGRGWVAQCKPKGYIGYFCTEEEAALAYNEAVTRIAGAFAQLNIVA